MIYILDLLNESQLKHINETFECSDYEVGTMAGLIRPEWKNNEEISGFERSELSKYVVEILNNSRDFTEITNAKTYAGVLFSKYEEGMFYNLHNDNYMMGDGTRTDFSTTIFLNSPDEYEGGELILQVGNQEFKYKLKAGQCIIYPTGLMHKVTPVTSGVRKVCVLWTESCVADADIRTLLADYYFMWSKYKREIYENIDDEFPILLESIRMRLLRKFGNFTGVSIQRNY